LEVIVKSSIIFFLVAFFCSGVMAEPGSKELPDKSSKTEAKDKKSHSKRVPSQYEIAPDYDFDWDMFNHQGRMIWTCRGVQTGIFVDESICSGKNKNDVRWPEKHPPAEWYE